MDPLDRPLVLWDGECGFCRRRVERWRRRTGEAVRYAPYQEADLEALGVSAEECRRSVQYLEPGGRRLDGARAVLAILAHGSGGGRFLALVGRLPGAGAVLEPLYRAVASQRATLSRLDRWFCGREPAQARFRLGTALCVRLVGLCFALAFASLLPQVRGLVGADGIVPVRDTLAVWRDQAETLGQSPYLLLPTLSWLSPSDALLVGQCLAGTALGLLVAAGLVPALGLALSFVLYLSLVSVGDVFLSYQWDALLLEAGLLAVFLSPWRLRARLRDAPEPPRAARWMAWLLVARLMVFSGVVKLDAGGSWADLSALTHHFETQPLPTPLAWYAHQLPPAVLRIACALVLAIELGAPLLCLFGRRARLLGAGTLVGLQVAIALTGNFGFFNLLSLALCLTLVDDGALSRWLPRGRSLAAAEPGRDRRVVKSLPLVAYALWALLLGGLFAVRLAGRWADRADWRKAGQELVVAAAPWRTISSYGLFAHMTEDRFEIEIQGSDDGQTWTSYPFRFKPGEATRGLPWVAPHMPRLDWQMWFAALAGWQRSPWFQSLCRRLLEGSPQVLGLFAQNPFPDGPPRYVRARFQRYRFSDRAERSRSGAIWEIEDLGPYISAQTLRPR